MPCLTGFAVIRFVGHLRHFVGLLPLNQFLLAVWHQLVGEPRQHELDFQPSQRQDSNLSRSTRSRRGLLPLSPAEVEYLNSQTVHSFFYTCANRMIRSRETPLKTHSMVPRHFGAASAILGAVLAWCAVTHLGAQASQCTEIPNPPGDLSLRLLLKNGRSEFHEGEIIALTAEYSALSSDKYVVNNRNYDRSGRLSGAEIFCIEPDRGIDPLDDYFHSMQAVMGGGIFSEQDPARHPLTMDLELNEWESLPPGSYRLTIIGNRLHLGQERDTTTWQNTIIPLRSNTVEFEVAPADPDWQASQLRSATRILDSPDAKPEEKKHAAQMLRFLGSEASTRELARRYGAVDDPFEWEFKFGLFGTLHRELAIQAMKAELSNPEHPVTREYISTLVALEMLIDPKWRLPTYDSSRQEEWHSASDAHYAEIERRVNEYMQQASMRPHDAAAQASTASEMLLSGLPLNQGEKTRWRQMLLSNWISLPIEKQNELIEDRWAQVGGPEWLPVLEQIVSGPANPNRAMNKANRETALLRLWQVAPEDARPLMIQEIAKPQADIRISVLGQLPEHSFPQFEAGWLDAIRQGRAADVDFQLIDRYGSENILPAVQSIYEPHSGEWGCTPQTAMLRYFLRIKPDYGVKELTAAIASRKSTGCYLMQMGGIGEYVRLPQVEKLAIRLLNDPVPPVASDAAEALQKYGSLETENALWTRLQQFQEQWKDKPDEMLHPRPNMIVFDKDSGLVDALVQGILHGQAWFADAATIRRLKEVSSPAKQNELDGALQSLGSGEFTLHMQWWPQDELNYTLGWYTGEGMASFEEKLAQFPPGSHFRMVTTKAEQEAHRAEFAKAERTASENGQAIDVLAPR
jgi:hypothetical protein